MPLSHILRECTGGYKLHKSQLKINHQTSNIKQFAKNENEFETLKKAVRIYNDDIGMEFGIDKCDMVIMRSGKMT